MGKWVWGNGWCVVWYRVVLYGWSAGGDFFRFFRFFKLFTIFGLSRFLTFKLLQNFWICKRQFGEMAFPCYFKVATVVQLDALKMPMRQYI